MKKIITLSVLSLLILPTMTNAQTTDTAGVDVRTRTELNSDLIDARIDANIEARQNLIEAHEERFMDRQENQEEFRVRLQEHREGFAERRTEVSARMEERKAQLLENRAEIKLRLQEAAKNRIGNFIDRIINHLNRITDRFDSASDKLAERIADFEDRGIDMTESIDFLAAADVQLEETKVVLAEVVADINTELDKDEVSRDTIKALIETGKDSVKEVREAYVKVIVSIRASLKVDTDSNSGDQEDADEEENNGGSE